MDEMRSSPRVRELLDWVQDSLRELAQEADQAKQEEAVKSYLSLMGKLHTYSLWNQLLIGLQLPNATLVAGMAKWNRLGRHVRPGEHGVRIVAPIVVKLSPGEEPPPRKLSLLEQLFQEKPEAPADHKVVGFRPAWVFDISQTEGAPLQEVQPYSPTESNEALRKDLIAVANRLGYAVRDRVPANTMSAWGYTAYGKKTIDLRTGGGVPVIAHELAHIVLGHGDNPSDGDERLHEVAAEAAAYAVCARYGVHAGSAARYIALWQGSSEDVLTQLTAVSRAAAQIIEAVESYRRGGADGSSHAGDAHTARP